MLGAEHGGEGGGKEEKQEDRKRKKNRLTSGRENTTGDLSYGVLIGWSLCGDGGDTADWIRVKGHASTLC